MPRAPHPSEATWLGVGFGVGLGVGVGVGSGVGLGLLPRARPHPACHGIAVRAARSPEASPPPRGLPCAPGTYLVHTAHRRHVVRTVHRGGHGVYYYVSA
jgi:hypothetical protein